LPCRNFETSAQPDHSHSIINEPSTLLIRKELGAAAQVFTVIFTVNLSGTSIGAGFRAIVKKGTFRDLSPSIGCRDDCGPDQDPPLWLRDARRNPSPSNDTTNSQEGAGFITKERIATSDKGLAIRVAAGQVPTDDVVGQRK
jgi:hypothetical protein